MSENRIPTYIFGPFRLEPQWQRLYRGETLLPLTRKRYEILLLLIENAGRVLKKEEIIRAIWPGQIVEESNLTQHVYVLRRMIEDDPRTPKYILTVSGEGYQFSSTVQILDESTPPVAASESPESDLAHSEPADQETWAEAGSMVPPPDAPAPDRSIGGGSLWRPGRPLILIGAVLLILLVTGLTYYWFNRDPAHESSATPVITPFLTMPGIKGSLSYSRDGRFLAFVSDGDNANTPDVFLKMIGGGEPIQITNSKEGEFFVCWSPDGRELAFLRWSPESPGDYQLVIVPTLGGVERVVGRVGGGLSWSPDGKYFAICDSDGPNRPFGVLLLSVDGQQRRTIATPDDPKGFDSTPRFSPSGKEIAFVRWRSSSSADLHIVNLDTMQTRRVTFDQRSINDLQWSPDGRTLFFISNRNGNHRLWEIPATGGEPQLINNVPVELVNFDISPTTGTGLNGRPGQTIAYTQKLNDTATEIVQLGSGTGPDQPSSLPGRCLINSSRKDDSPRFSADGTQVVFISDRSGADEVWIGKADCSQIRQLTSIHGADIGSPRWSPDGKRIVFDHHIDGQAEIMTIDVFSGKLSRITNHPAADMVPSWSRDGRWIYFTSERSGSPQIWKVEVDGNLAESIQVTRNDGFEAIEAEEGRSILYTKNHFMWRKDLETGEEELIKELKDTPVRRYWDASRQAIYFVPQNGTGRAAVFKLNLLSRQITRVIELSGYTHRFVPGISISPREDRIATSFISYRFGDIMLVENWR